VLNAAETDIHGSHQQWVTRLIELYNINETNINDKHSRKKEVWQNIAGTLSSEGLLALRAGSEKSDDQADTVETLTQSISGTRKDETGG